MLAAVAGPGSPAKSLPLILARELAANLATPMFLIDAAGTLVFYNEAAELLIGKPFGEQGEISALEFGAMLQLGEKDGSPLRRRDTPAGVAFYERPFAHCSGPVLTSTSGDRPLLCRAWPIASPSTSRPRCSRCAWPTSPPGSSSTTSPRTLSPSGRRRSGRRRSPIRGRPWVIASRR